MARAGRSTSATRPEHDQQRGSQYISAFTGVAMRPARAYDGMKKQITEAIRVSSGGVSQPHRQS